MRNFTKYYFCAFHVLDPLDGSHLEVTSENVNTFGYTKYYKGDQIKDVMGGTCSMQNFRRKIWKEEIASKTQT
jgi:hypothetical protein